jgi:siroheme synthase (precorrin-2 oxidase/ferrochelatase)
MSLAFQPPRRTDPRPDQDRIVVIGSSPDILDLLRLASIRSDNVVLIADRPGEAAQRYAERFAIEHDPRPWTDRDLAGATAALVSVDRTEDGNRIVRSARRQGIPVHVSGRPLVSDFSLLEFLEQRSTLSA